MQNEKVCPNISHEKHMIICVTIAITHSGMYVKYGEYHSTEKSISKIVASRINTSFASVFLKIISNKQKNKK